LRTKERIFKRTDKIDTINTDKRIRKQALEVGTLHFFLDNFFFETKFLGRDIIGYGYRLDMDSGYGL
jgi:hypothetical protein